MIRAVLDTNVLVSGLIRASGNEALLLLAVQHGLLRPCFSEAIAAEYAAVLARPKFAFPAEETTTLLAMLRSRGEIVVPQPVGMSSPDPDDTKFLDCAIAAGADFIVTGNKRHFPNAPYGAVQVVSAGELLNRLALEA